MLAKMPTMLSLAGILLFAVACDDTQYRHEVDLEEGDRVLLAADGWLRYDGYGNVVGDFGIGQAVYHREGSRVSIRLVGVVHMADREYYDQLQGILDKSDLVFYEGVRFEQEAEELVDPAVRQNWVIQSAMLGLYGQVEVIDYDRENWRQVDDMEILAATAEIEDHSEIWDVEFDDVAVGGGDFQDDSAVEQEILEEELSDLEEVTEELVAQDAQDAAEEVIAEEEISEEGIDDEVWDEEDFEQDFALGFQHTLEGITLALEGKRLFTEPLGLWRYDDRIKHLYAQSMMLYEDDPDEAYASVAEWTKTVRRYLDRVEAIFDLDDTFGLLNAFLEGVEDGVVEMGTQILGQRNDFVLKELEAELATLEAEDGPPLELSIFYGAMHMPNFEKELEKLGYVREGEIEHLTAWSMNSRAQQRE